MTKPEIKIRLGKPQILEDWGVDPDWSSKGKIRGFVKSLLYRQASKSGNAAYLKGYADGQRDQAVKTRRETLEECYGQISNMSLEPVKWDLFDACRRIQSLINKKMNKENLNPGEKVRISKGMRKGQFGTFLGMEHTLLGLRAKIEFGKGETELLILSTIKKI